jgi:hypothetical protein
MKSGTACRALGCCPTGLNDCLKQLCATRDYISLQLFRHFERDAIAVLVSATLATTVACYWMSHFFFYLH